MPRQTVFSARTILFDWDGTLLDSFRADTRAYLSMFSTLGIPWTTRELAKHYHPDWYRVYQAAQLDRSRWKEADRLWRAAYALEEPKLLSGTRDVLRRLSGRYVLGIVTSGDGTRVRPQLKSLGVERYFSVCVCSEDAKHRKPHPAPLNKALRALSAKPNETVYVGDAPQDVEMARRARVRVFGVIGPFPTEKNLRAAEPELLLKSVRELPRHVRPIR